MCTLDRYTDELLVNKYRKSHAQSSGSSYIQGSESYLCKALWASEEGLLPIRGGSGWLCGNAQSYRSKIRGSSPADGSSVVHGLRVDLRNVSSFIVSSPTHPHGRSPYLSYRLPFPVPDPIYDHS